MAHNKAKQLHGMGAISGMGGWYVGVDSLLNIMKYLRGTEREER